MRSEGGKAQIKGGGRMAMELHRLLTAKGVGVSYECVRRYRTRKVGRLRRTGRRPSAPIVARPAIPSARKLSFPFICPPKGNKVEPSHEAAEPSVLDRLRAGVPDLDAAWKLASEFASMLRREVSSPLSEWLTRAERSGVREVQNFARGLREDEAAVTAALTESWSNGQVEGQVNRLKFIKRSMYGRAGWRLLRARVKRSS